MEIKGRIHKIMEPQTGSSNGRDWKRQEFVVEQDGGERYPRYACFSVWGDQRINMAQFSVGQSVVVSFDVNAREYEGRWFTTLEAWRMNVQGMEGTPSAPAAPNYAPQPQYVQPTNQAATSQPELSEEGDDLPF